MAEKHTRNQQTDMKADVLAAIAVCRERRDSSLLADPLAFPEFDDSSAENHFGDCRPVEVEFVTRPKQSGGTRLELVPDFATSVRLQVLAQRLAKRAPSLPQSISALALDPKYIHLHPYELWWEHISTWIRHRLVEGKTVIMADIRNYFSSIKLSSIEDSLREARLTEQDISVIIQTIGEINSIKDQHGATRRGVPISQDNLFWFIADLVLRPVDEQLSQDENIAGYIRWVDDFFIAIDPDSANYALGALSAALEIIGFELNDKKTRKVQSIDGFERYALTFEHRMVTSLMMSIAHGGLVSSQQDAFKRLVETDRVCSIEHARLWKRIYVLATKLRSSALEKEAFNDLERFPTIEKQALTYLHTLRWPHDTALQAVNQLAQARTDSLVITSLKALLLSILSKQEIDIPVLHGISASTKIPLHPYARVLLHACLVFQSANNRPAVARQMLSSVVDSPSPIARRLALELLWLIPGTRHLAQEHACRDKSYTVRGLSIPFALGADISHMCYWSSSSPAQENIFPYASMNAELRNAFFTLTA